MKKFNTFFFLLLSLILLSSASANNKDFDTEKMLSDLEQQLRLSNEKYELLAKDAEARMKDILDSEQMAKLKKQIDDVRQKVNEKVFAANK